MAFVYLDHILEVLFLERVFNVVLLTVCFIVMLRQRGSAYVSKAVVRYHASIVVIYFCASLAASTYNFLLTSWDAVYKWLPVTAELDLVACGSPTVVSVTLGYLYVHSFNGMLETSTFNHVFRVLVGSGVLFGCALIGLCVYEHLYLNYVYTQGEAYFEEVVLDLSFAEHADAFAA
ncbi:hypothetical protein KIPB_013003, partial [Kipferlia bialata]|eukprot:g13003.t1